MVGYSANPALQTLQSDLADPNGRTQRSSSSQRDNVVASLHQVKDALSLDPLFDPYKFERLVRARGLESSPILSSQAWNGPHKVAAQGLKCWILKKACKLAIKGNCKDDDDDGDDDDGGGGEATSAAHAHRSATASAAGKTKANKTKNAFKGIMNYAGITPPCVSGISSMVDCEVEAGVAASICEIVGLGPEDPFAGTELQASERASAQPLRSSLRARCAECLHDRHLCGHHGKRPQLCVRQGAASGDQLGVQPMRRRRRLRDMPCGHGACARATGRLCDVSARSVSDLREPHARHPISAVCPQRASQRRRYGFGNTAVCPEGYGASQACGSGENMNCKVGWPGSQRPSIAEPSIVVMSPRRMSMAQQSSAGSLAMHPSRPT